MNKKIKFKVFKFKPVTIDRFRVKSIDYHRNGIGGEGFYIAVMTDKAEKRDMLVTLFPEAEGICCAVVALDAIPDIRFMYNSWRGDHYVDAMRRAVNEFNVQQRKHLELLSTRNETLSDSETDASDSACKH